MKKVGREVLICAPVLALTIGTWPAAAAPARDRVVALLGQEPAELFGGFVSNLLVENDVESPMWCALVGRDDNWKLHRPGGILRDAQGKPFRMTIMTTTANAVREQVEQIADLER